MDSLRKSELIDECLKLAKQIERVQNNFTKKVKLAETQGRIVSSTEAETQAAKVTSLFHELEKKTNTLYPVLDPREKETFWDTMKHVINKIADTVVL